MCIDREIYKLFDETSICTKKKIQRNKTNKDDHTKTHTQAHSHTYSYTKS